MSSFRHVNCVWSSENPRKNDEHDEFDEKIFAHVKQNSFLLLFKIVSKRKQKIQSCIICLAWRFSNIKQKEKQDENSFYIRALSLLYLRKHGNI